jgi:chromosomal replication initiation ATPase DnaA
MKTEIFNQYVDKVTSLFRITKEELFSKSKKTTFADARHLLYYLCSQRNMKLITIQTLMGENGYNVPHANVIHGITKIEGRIKDDKDYVQIIKNIENSVFI